MPTFKTQAQIESQLALPIGFPTRAYRDAKFAAPHRCEAPPDALAASATLYHTQTTNVTPSDYLAPEKSVGLQILPMEKPCLSESTSLGAYPAPNSLHSRLRLVGAEALERAFAALDQGGEGHVLLSELRMLLVTAYAACGLGVPEEATLATLTNLYEREGARRSDGAVLLPLHHVLAGCAACADMLEEEAALGRPEVLARVSSLAVKEARARDRSVPTSPSFEGPPRARLPPLSSPLAFAHATMGASASARAASSSSSSTLSSPPAKVPGVHRQSEGEREALRRTAGAGATLSLSPATGLLDASSSPRERFLTAGPMGSPSSAPAARGMNLGALRQAQLTGDAVLGGRELPSPSAQQYRLAGPAYLTSTERDYGAYGSAPSQLPVREAGVAGFAQTARELGVGTTRVSQHVPCYTGHVPKEPHGASAAYGLGATQRNSFHRSTNLVDNFRSRVSGYTGYLPRAAMYQTVDVDKVRGVEAESEYDHNVSAGDGRGGGWLGALLKVVLPGATSLTHTHTLTLSHPYLPCSDRVGPLRGTTSPSLRLGGCTAQ